MYITKRIMNTVSTMLRISGPQSKRRQEAHEKCTGLPTRADRTADRLAATLWTHNHLSTNFTLKKKKPNLKKMMRMTPHLRSAFRPTEHDHNDTHKR